MSAEPIAIIGLAGRFPSAADINAFWRNIRDGVESLETFSDAQLDEAGVSQAVRTNPRFVPKGTMIEKADHFDAAFFGYSPREAEIIDPQQRVFLECAWEAVEHAGYAGDVSGRAVGVYAGASMNTYLLAQVMWDRALVAAAGAYQLMIGNDKDYVCTRVAYELDLRGPAVTVQTACSTSLVAVHAACRGLQRRECDLALAGGVSISFPERTGYLYEEGMIFSPDGHCRPFDARANGTRSGNGAGIVVLKRLNEALADRDTIHAVILGAAVNNDGAGKAGFTAPSVDGQAAVISMALAEAGITPRTIGFVEAHGTATPLGDPIEIAALTRAFRAATPDAGFCHLGSLKGNLGHLDAAAGVAGLIKAVLVLKHREIPPLVNFETPNPRLELDGSPFVASASRSAWMTDGGLRRAGVSSFGIGGTNAHVVVEEAPRTEAGAPRRNAHLLVWSARTTTALDAGTDRLLTFFSENPETSIADVAYTLQVGRQPFRERRAAVVHSVAHAVELLREPRRAHVVTGKHEGAARPVAFLFSGQGSQHPGMAVQLYQNERVYREAFDRCATLLDQHHGVDLRAIVSGGASGEAALNETRLAQPALFALEYSLAMLWREWGVSPSAMLGHSMGEFVAAHLAGVMSLEDALMLVAARGRLMQALPRGAMLAVNLPADSLGPWMQDGVEVAAVNAPEMCTVSGATHAIDALATRLTAARIEHRVLHTSHAFHSAAMEPAVDPFVALVATVPLCAPRIRYVSNVTGEWITPEQATTPAYYGTQLRRPVQFDKGVRTIASADDPLLLEIGPGNALYTLARLAIGPAGARRVIASLSHPGAKRPDAEAMLDAAGRMWTAGASIDWKRMQVDEQLRRVPLPTYAFDHEPFRPAPATAAVAPNAAVPSRSDDVGDWFYAPTWRRDAASGPIATLADTWLLLSNPGALQEGVAAKLREAGADTVIVEGGDRLVVSDRSRANVRTDSHDDFAGLVRALLASGRRIGGVIHLWSMQARPDGITADAHAGVHAYRSLVAIAASFGADAMERVVPVIVGTTGAQSVLDEGVSRPGAALISGPILVLPLEVPGLQTRAVDLAFGADAHVSVQHAADALVREATLRDGERVVAWRAGRRWVRRAERIRIPDVAPESLPIKERGVYMILGGLGGIGTALGDWLARTYRARLLITTRQAFPERTEWETWVRDHDMDDRISRAITALREMERTGATVHVVRADVADEQAMGDAVSWARRQWGAIDGVIHAAGLMGGGLAVLKPHADVDVVLAPKVTGMHVLADVLGDTPLDFVALCSSFTGLSAGPGTSDYASSNAYLDAFAESTLRPAAWQRVIALDWWAWSETGMAKELVVPEALRAARAAFVHAGIPTAQGVKAFSRALASGASRLIVTPFDFTHPTFLEPSRDVQKTAHVREPDRTARRTVTHARPRLEAAFEPPAGAVEEELATIWTALLGVEGIGANDDFFALGGHSLLATRLVARIEEASGVRLPIRAVFDAPTIRQLAQLIEATTSAVALTDAHTATGDREEIEF